MYWEYKVVGPSSPSSPSQEEAAATTPGPPAPPYAPGGVIRASVGHFRWVICALLLFATVKSYMDRNVLASLKHTLQPILGWNDIDYGHIVAAFQLFYAFGMLIAGRMVDRLGTRKAFSIFMVVWSLAAMSYGIAPRLAVLVGSTFYYLHGLWSFFPAARGTVAGFIVVSAAMGLGQSGLFPASIKAVAEWFPKKERALATGIFNAGTNVGASITPLVVALITIRLGLPWPWAFYVVGSLGFVWLILWIPIYRIPQEHPSVSKAELAYILSDPQDAGPKTKIKFLALLPYRQTWAFVIGKLCIDPIWWFWLFWAPDLFQRRFGMTLGQIALPILVIYLVSDVGSVLGGGFSGYLIARGASVNVARKTVMLICAIAVFPVMFAVRSNNVWIAVALISIAAAAHQAFSANLFTLPSDMFPSRAVGSVVGIGGAAGGLGGFIIANTVGHVLQRTGSYGIPLFIAGIAYLIALAFIQLLAPRLKPVSLGASAQA
jgi:ACS family hexuronate transporter-like MFS transporter